MPQLLKKSNFKVLFLLLLLIIIIFIGVYNTKVKKSVGGNVEKTFSVANGQNATQIAQNLKKEGLINSTFFFTLYVGINKKSASFQVGDFDLNSSMSIKEIVRDLTEKNILKPEEKITFIEGWSLKDYDKALKQSRLLNVDNFLELTKKDYSKQFSFLADKPLSHDLEGYLFPDTYRFFLDIEGQDLILKILSNFDKKLDSQMRADIKAQGKTIFEIVTMASIIEKEVRSEKDMKIVSGIFWNRIKNGQALESCASLAYILGVNKSQYSYEDTRVDSPYNTYLHRGLPPGPIANPGLKAIEAAIYPQETNYNYFLTATESGKTIFNESYEQHLIDKNKYIK